jgi:hypothetical protein
MDRYDNGDTHSGQVLQYLNYLKRGGRIETYQCYPLALINYHEPCVPVVGSSQNKTEELVNN